MRQLLPALFLVTGCDCGSERDDPPTGSSSAAAGGGGASATSSSGSIGPGGGMEACAPAPGELDVPVDCSSGLPDPDFTPVLKWTFSAAPGYAGAAECVLVANLDDDNQDGSADLCDVPDVLVMTRAVWIRFGTLHVLSGASGVLKTQYPAWLWSDTCPAAGDLDGDGSVEIVVLESSGRLVALRGDMTEMWRAPEPVFGACLSPPCDGTPSSSIAIHDLEGDGQAEILIGNRVYESDGALRFAAPPEMTSLHWDLIGPDHALPTVADLDGDGALEVLIGSAAFRADGDRLWSAERPRTTPYAVDVDADGLPEVLLFGEGGETVIDGDGSILYEATFSGTDHRARRLATVADLDGDDALEIAAVGLSAIVAYDLAPSTSSSLWAVSSPTSSGTYRSSAYDFRGTFDVLASNGPSVSLFWGTTGHVDWSLAPLPTGANFDAIVADVDNDRSADIVVSNGGPGAQVHLAVFEDLEKRFSPARRIWNQEAYVADSVAENGRIAHGLASGSFRAQRARPCQEPPR